jgi:cytochrome c-type biogenesis protein CcmH
MVARYGEFVMYKPPVEPNTYLLWVGPFLFLLIGLWILIRIIRNNQQNNELDK